MSENTKPETYEELVAAGAAGLAEDEYWVIDHDEGPLIETASKDFTMPVRIFCTALDVDWDDAQEQGWRLGRVHITKEQGTQRTVQ